MKKINYGTAEVIKTAEGGARLIKFNEQYYTVYGRMFAVKGDHLETVWKDVCEMKRYGFNDFDNLKDMYPLWGGQREGAGRPSSGKGRKKKQFFVTDEEVEKLKEYLEFMRR